MTGWRLYTLGILASLTMAVLLALLFDAAGGAS